MKTLVIDIKTPAAGDLVVVEYASTRGGCTHVKYLILGAHQVVETADGAVVTSLKDVPAETPLDITTALAAKIKNDWMPEAFEARANAASGSLVINCTGLVQDVTFRAYAQGDGGTSVELLEL